MPIQRFNVSQLEDYLLSGATVLVPNQRIRDAILHGFADYSTASCWFTPDVNAVDVWLKNQWNGLASQGCAPFSSLRLLDSMEESLIWMDIVDQHHQDGSLLNTEQAAATAQHAYQLYRHWLDDGQAPQSPPPASAVAELQHFNQWCSLFIQRCDDQQLISLADATHRLLVAYSSGRIKPPDNLLVVNFYQPPPLYSKLFRTLTGEVGSRHVLTADKQPRPDGQLHAFVDLETEVRACANWAKQLTKTQPDAHIGVVFGGDSGKQPIIDRIFNDVFDPAGFVDLLQDSSTVNGGLGKTSILDSRQIDEAMLLLSLGNSQLDTADFCRLLQSPTLIGYVQELEARMQLEAHIRQNLATRCTLSQLLRLMGRQDKAYHCPLLLDALLELANKARAHRFETPGDWARLFEEQLDALGWPADHPVLETTQVELLRGWKAVLRCFSGYRAKRRKIDRSTALSRLRTLCQKTTFAEPFDPGRHVSLYSLIDAVGLEFSHVWFLGFDDKSQPAAANPSPFISHQLQRVAAIPGSHSDTQLELARQAFEVICGSTSGEIHASYHQLEGDESLRVSSLLASFHEVTTQGTEVKYLNSLALAACGAVELDSLSVDNATELSPAENLQGGQAIFSDQSSCPFRAFANHRLNCTPLDSIKNGLDARTRGTALHIALERLFAKITTQQQLQALSGVQAQDLISLCSDAAIEYLESRNPELMTPRFISLERQRLHMLLTDYLELEKERPEFQVIDAEKTVSWGQQQLQVKLKIDRIDRLGDGTLGIIDYKTGKYIQSVGKLAGERPENLQLPLYHCAASGSLGDTVSAIAIAQINAENVCFHGLAAADNFHSAVKPVSNRNEFDRDWQTLTDEWQRLLSRLATDFIQGVSDVDPVNGDKTCEYCRLQPLCRIRELSPSGQYQDQQSEEFDE